jgi:hypothetical protein
LAPCSASWRDALYNPDPRQVVAGIHARYFDAELDDRSLTPGKNPQLGSASFEDWLARPRE